MAPIARQEFRRPLSEGRFGKVVLGHWNGARRTSQLNECAANSKPHTPRVKPQSEPLHQAFKFTNPVLAAIPDDDQMVPKRQLVQSLVGARKSLGEARERDVRLTLEPNELGWLLQVRFIMCTCSTTLLWC